MRNDPAPEPNQLAAWSAELRPRGVIEGWLVARAARAATRVDRLAHAADTIETSDPADKSIPRLRRDEAAAERCLHRSLALLARGRTRSQPLWAVDPDPTREGVEPIRAEPRSLPDTSCAPLPADGRPAAEECGTLSVPVPTLAVVRPSETPPWQRICNPEGDLPTTLPTWPMRC